MLLTPETSTRLGLAHFTVLDVAPIDLIGLAASIGYAAIGLRLHPAFPGSPFYEIPAGSALMGDVRRRLADNGITVYDIEFICIDAAFEPIALRPMLVSAAELGARRLSVCGDDPDRLRMIDKFGELCDVAGQFEMGVDLEIMPWRQVSSLAAAVDVVGSAGRSNGAILIDALHLSRSGSKPGDLASLEPGLIRSAQMCDAAAQRPASVEGLIAEARGGRLLPGEGALPLQSLLAELPDHAVLSVEVPRGAREPDDHARRVFGAACRVINECVSEPSTV
jgi:sugar phosphate isomerase/epimerase